MNENNVKQINWLPKQITQISIPKPPSKMLYSTRVYDIQTNQCHLIIPTLEILTKVDRCQRQGYIPG